MAWFVYVLQSDRDARFYIGSTENLERRLAEHNRGKTRSLRHRHPLRLVYAERFDTSEEARKREKQLKSFKGGDAFQELLRRGARAVEWARLESG
ncbi:MAG: GIY-YIG nuclease family protein [Acidobacteria bacterium]|nr:GIY-YIG nuclease family protein [Acidobacteriota bacterium]